MASRKRWWWRQRRAKTGHRVVFTRGVYSGVLTDRHGAPGVVAGVAVRGCHGLMGEKWFGCEGSWLLRGVTHIPLRGIIVDVSRVIDHWCSTNPLEVYVMRSPDVQDLGWSAARGGCACRATTSSAQEAAVSTPAAGAVVAEYLVSGMTCAHCVNGVSEKLSALPGVASVVVNLDLGQSSKVTVRSVAPLNLSQVAEAMDAAGYQLVGKS